MESSTTGSHLTGCHILFCFDQGMVHGESVNLGLLGEVTRVNVNAQNIIAPWFPIILYLLFPK